jgi:hypothetical protein
MYPIHPYSEIFPDHADTRLDELKKDIQENGQLEAVMLYQDKVLDGRRRQLACESLGIETRYEQFQGDDNHALRYVWSKNYHRRHLSDSERTIVAAKIAKLSAGGDRGNQYTSGKPSNGGLPTQAEAASMMNVAPKGVERAKKVLDKGTPELQKAMEDGTLSVSDAAEVASQPKKIQKRAVKDVKKGKAATAAASAKEQTKILCERCQEIKPGRGLIGCQACARLQAEAANGKAKKTKPAAQPPETGSSENGAAEKPNPRADGYDFTQFEQAFGNLKAQIDTLYLAHGLGTAGRVKQDRDYKDLMEQLADFRNSFAARWKELKKGKVTA